MVSQAVVCRVCQDLLRSMHDLMLSINILLCLRKSTVDSHDAQVRHLACPMLLTELQLWQALYSICQRHPRGVCHLTESDSSGDARPIYCCRERQAMEGEVMQMQEDMQALVEADLDAQQVQQSTCEVIRCGI